MASILPLRKRAASSSSPITGRPKLLHLRQLRRIERHAGADHDQILAAKGKQAVAAGLDHDALFEQRGDFLGQRLRPMRTSETVTCAPCGAETDAAARPDFPSPTTRTFLPFSSIIRDPILRLRPRDYLIVHRAARVCYRSFSVVSANNANTRAPIQKRTMTLDSLQPNCSK